MIGQIVVIGKETYLMVNKQGTLEKLPKIPWWSALYLYIYSQIKGGLCIDFVRNYVRENTNEK